MYERRLTDLTESYVSVCSEKNKLENLYRQGLGDWTGTDPSDKKIAYPYDEGHRRTHNTKSPQVNLPVFGVIDKICLSLNFVYNPRKI